MFTDGENVYPGSELIQLKNTFKSNPERWTDPTGTHSILIPLIITNKLQIDSLVKMSNNLNDISKEIWGEENFCILRQDIKIDQLATTIIERFVIN